MLERDDYLKVEFNDALTTEKVLPQRMRAPMRRTRQKRDVKPRAAASGMRDEVTTINFRLS